MWIALVVKNKTVMGNIVWNRFKEENHTKDK